jgi:CheY-like chemotaxis protein
MRMLVVDDSQLIRHLLRSTVEDLGHECIVAPDGNAAWELLLAGGIDVVISDWMMPGLDGPELCRRVRTHPGGAYVYFILLTVLTDKEHVVAGMRAGADDYLVKPTDPLDLEAALIAAVRVIELHRRRERLLGLARRLARESDSEQLLAALPDEATALVGGDACGVFRWDEAAGHLVGARSSVLPGQQFERLRPGQGVAGTAALRREPVIVNDYPADFEFPPPGPAPDVRTAIGVPLLSEGRLLGALSVFSYNAERLFTPADADILELFGTIAAEALAGLERAQLMAISMTSRELAHLLHNDLGIVALALDLVQNEPSVPDELRPDLDEATECLAAAGRRIGELQRLTRFETRETPIGPALDLERSAQPRGRGRG